MPARTRALALAAAGLAALSVAPAHAGTKTAVLDGKKHTYVSMQASATRGVPSMDPNVALHGASDAAVAACTPPTQCARLPFVYAPAMGVQADLGVATGWYWDGLTRIDLYLLDGSKVIASCAGEMGNTRRLLVPRSKLKPGKTYTAVMYFAYSVTNDEATLSASLPGAPATQGWDTSNPVSGTKYASCSDQPTLP